MPITLVRRGCIFIQRVIVAFACLASTAALSGAERPHLFGVGQSNGGWTILDPAGYAEAVYDTMAQAGATSTRLCASWAEMEPARGQYQWSALDSDVANCISRGITPYCLIVNTPAWASPTGQREYGYPPRDENLPDFRAFCTQLAVRYAGLVTHWEVWNEQNGYGWHTDGGFNRVDEYAPVLHAAWEGLKTGNPTCQVAVGGLDDPDITPGDPTGWRGAYYMGLLYDELARRGWGSEPLFDAVADHPYQSSQPLSDLRLKLRALHNQLSSHGNSNTSIWITEYGWSTKSMSRAQQAQLFTDYLAILFEPEFEYVTMACCLAVSDNQTGYEGWGLTDQNLRPKPSFWSFQAYPRISGPQISRLVWKPVAGDALQVSWQTDVPATTQVEFGPGTSYGTTSPLDARLLTEHVTVVSGLIPGVNYYLRALATSPGLTDNQSGDYVVRCSYLTVPNGDFEEGVPGIATGWRTVGRSFLTDGATVSRVYAGNHAQSMVTVGSWGQMLDDSIYTFVGVPIGQRYTFSAVTRGQTGLIGVQNRLSRQVGTDPTGGTDPNAASVVWSEQRFAEDAWEEQTVTSKATAAVVTVFVRARAVQSLTGTHWVHIDNTRFTALEPTFVAADFDRDNDVDMEDFGHLQACMTGPNVPQETPSCANTRLDGDLDVDDAEVAILQACLSGPGLPAAEDCVALP